MPFLPLREETYQNLLNLRKDYESIDDLVQRVIEAARCYMVLQGMENTDEVKKE